MRLLLIVVALLAIGCGECPAPKGRKACEAMCKDLGAPMNFYMYDPIYQTCGLRETCSCLCTGGADCN